MVLLAAGLSQTARANWQFIAGGVRRGLSSNQIGRDLRAGGRRISRQDLQGAVRHFRGVADTGRYLRSLRPTTLIDPSRLRPSRGRHMSRRFAYDVGFNATDSRGITKRRQIRIITDKILTPGELLEEFDTILEEADESSESGGLFDVDGATFTGGFRRA